MDKATYISKLGVLNAKMYRRCKRRTGHAYSPYNHLWWLTMIEAQRATDLKTLRYSDTKL